MKHKVMHFFLGFFSFLLLWEFLFLILKNHMLPSPFQVLLSMVTEKNQLFLHGLASSLRIISSIFLALLLGLPIGMLIGNNPSIKKIVDPIIYFIYPIPKVAFLPVFMILFGLGNVSKIVLVVFIVVFQIIIAVRDGVHEIQQDYIRVIHGFSLKKKDLLCFCLLPAIIPRTISAIRISIGIALASLFFAENYATKYGVGYYILSAWTKMDYIEMFSGILTLGFLGILFFGLLDWLETKLVSWKE